MRKAEYNKTYYKNHKKQIQKYKREYQKKNRSKLLTRAAKWYREHKDTNREYQLQRCYGISITDYNQLFIVQEGKCAICGCDSKYLRTKLSVDHNHSTGRVRGLLCVHCNGGLGYIENVNFIVIASKYLSERN
jgi:hypothetical protein